MRFASIRPFVGLCCLVGSLSWGLTGAGAAEATIDLNNGVGKMEVPEGWVKKQPKFNMIEHEFEIPAVEGDATPGRATVMGAAGSVDANIERWYGQFKQPDGSNTSEKAKMEKRTVGGQEVIVVDVSGTYLDKAGPFAPGPATERENYRMLAAIVQMKKDGQPVGNYFIKFYGPKNTVTKSEAGFMKMIDSLQVK